VNAIRSGGSPGSGYNYGVTIALRDFRVEDFEFLWNLDQLCFPPGIAYSRRDLAAYQRFRGSFTVVAEALDANLPGIVGFVVGVAQRNGIGHIVTIDVSTSARRSGVGSSLLQAAEQRLRSDRCHSVSLETAVDNHAALNFYKRHGYKLVKTCPRYYSNGVDALVLEKDLLSAAQAS
jgi:[ribosomal protein S18]-alanine N-acetyltransferase